MPTLFKCQHGFMLIEIIISMVIVALGLMSYIHLQSKILTNSINTNQGIIMLITAKSAIDLKSIDHNERDELNNAQTAFQINWQPTKLLINNREEFEILVQYAP